jgi:hypothetical protein
VTCGRLLVFSWYFGFLNHDILVTKTLLKVTLYTITFTTNPKRPLVCSGFPTQQVLRFSDSYPWSGVSLVCSGFPVPISQEPSPWPPKHQNMYNTRPGLSNNFLCYKTQTNLITYGSWIYNYLHAISAYHHLSREFESHSWRGVLDTSDTFFNVNDLIKDK